MKISSYLKALAVSPDKSIKKLPHWRDQVSISPKDQGDLSGLTLRTVGANSWTPNNVNLNYLQKMYDCHDLVYNCIHLVSSTFGLAKLKVKVYKEGKWHFDPTHPVQRLIDNPNSSMTGFDLRQAYIVHRLLYGTVGFIMLRNDMMIDSETANSCPACYEQDVPECPHLLWSFHTGPITQIMPVHLDRLSKKAFNTPKGIREYFVYNFNGQFDMPIHPDNIMTDPYYNSAGSFYGNSPTAQVQRWLELDLGLTKQIGAYFVNNAIPSMLINIKPPSNGGNYTKDPSQLINMIKENWMKKFSMGGDGNESGTEVRSPAFTYGEIDIHKIQDTLKDIVVKPLFYEIQNRICQAYNVPPNYFEFGQDYGAQSTTIEQQEKNFFNRAIGPELHSFREKLKRYILPSYCTDGTIDLEWDLSEMGIASFLEKERKLQVLKEWELGLETRDATRELLGKNPMGGDLGDNLYRETLMSDGTNNLVGGDSKPKNPLEDNRLKT